MAESRFELDEAAIREATGWDSGAGRWLAGRGEQIADLARARVPHDTGRLAGSIHVVQSTDPFDGSLNILVGAGAHADAPLSRPGWESAMPYGLALDHGPPPGTRNRGKRGRPRTRRPEHKFMTEPLDEVAGAAVT